MHDRQRTIGLETLGEATSAAAEQAATGSPIVLTREERPVAVILSLEWLGDLQRDRELLRRLALGELESTAGEGVDLDAVLEDCRMLLEES